MMFFYYNLVANSQPQSCARADQFCSKKRVKNILIYTISSNYATITIREQVGLYKSKFPNFSLRLATVLNSTLYQPSGSKVKKKQ